MPTKTIAAPKSRVRLMTAAILIKQNEPLAIEELEIPALGVGQILVRVRYSSVCGKQIDEIVGKRGEDPYLPHLLGHEGAGTVEEVGPGVRKVKPGDAVVIHWIKGPGIDSSSPKFLLNGGKVDAGCATTFSDHSIVSENRVTPIPNEVPFDVAALLGCAVTTGLGIVFNDLKLRPAQSIAVFGAGGVGLNAIQGAAMVSAYPIIAVDVNEGKLSRAKEFGATHTINVTKIKAAQALAELTQGQGLDAVVDTTGDTSVIETAFNATSNTGTTVLAGVPRHDKRITIDSFTLHFGRRIFGSHGGDTKPQVDIPRYLALYKQRKLKLDELITHRFPLDKVNDAISAVRRGEAAKCVVEMP